MREQRAGNDTLLLHGVDVRGHTAILRFEGITEAEALRLAAARGFRVASVELEAAARPAASGRAAFPLLLFTQELLALLEAGLHLNEALASLQAKESHAGVAGVMAGMLQSLLEGHSFSDVLAQWPQHFPDIFVATVRAAERTGDLAPALSRYIAYQLQFDQLKKKLVTAAIYPTMLLAVGSFVTLFLLGYVVPRFAVVYESAGRDMPWLSGLLLGFGRMVAGHWQLALAMAVGGAVLLASTLLRRQGRTWLLERVLRLPWLASRVRQFRLARFYRALSLLLASGIALPRALGMVGGLLGPQSQEQLAQCLLAVQQGRSLSSALAAAGLVGPVTDSLIQVGERSGQLADMLERAARFSDDQFARWVDWASRLLEPVLMIVIGVVIGGIVVLMYLPIFDLAGSL
ncbi:type II secretion system F family protein [Pseudoduganella ginsengisoli]|uniref:Type II secretion system F family protein n=1 Tax=Pseudoduganella ginsengisoli TaxID=1462440 RepID=A0A6L6Q0F7_9BURK|nr:type II secretion system F family protein [Pseudoduganella ginsengisoli]MTW03115.1 type II secretion system F family protein [Pseudoduganella ginsengisoli]